MTAKCQRSLTDDVGCLLVVCKVLLGVVLLKLPQRTLVTGLQDFVEEVQLAQVTAQAVDPQGLLVPHDGPAQVGFTWGRRRA